MELQWRSYVHTQAVGATTPAFTVLLGWLIYGHTETQRVCCALIPVVLGIVITSGFEPSFHIIGLLFLLSSTAARAYKSLLQVCLTVVHFASLRALLQATLRNLVENGAAATTAAATRTHNHCKIKHLPAADLLLCFDNSVRQPLAQLHSARRPSVMLDVKCDVLAVMASIHLSAPKHFGC
jgi:hypothetical protein